MCSPSPHKGRKISFEKSMGDYSIRLNSFGRAQVIEECQAFISIIGGPTVQANGQKASVQGKGDPNKPVGSLPSVQPNGKKVEPQGRVIKGPVGSLPPAQPNVKMVSAQGQMDRTESIRSLSNGQTNGHTGEKSGPETSMSNRGR